MIKKASDMVFIDGEMFKKDVAKKGVKYESISEVMGLNRSYISNACSRGRISKTTLIEACRIVNLNPDNYIVDEADEEEVAENPVKDKELAELIYIAKENQKDFKELRKSMDELIEMLAGSLDVIVSGERTASEPKIELKPVYDYLKEINSNIQSVKTNAQRHYETVLRSGLSKAIFGTKSPSAEVKNTSVKETPDSTSIIFTESVKYFNEKNKTDVEVPSGTVLLSKAVETAKLLNVSLEELCKDHTEDRILDEICMYEEKIKELKAKIGF